MEENITMSEMEKETEEMTALHYLTEENASFIRTEGGFVRLEYDGRVWERVQVIRLFPFTEPDKYISLRTVDERSKEIGVIADLEQVSVETRKLLEEQLNLHYFTPIIEKIIDIKDEYGYAYFHVMTDRGECRFTINMGATAIGTGITAEPGYAEACTKYIKQITGWDIKLAKDLVEATNDTSSMTDSRLLITDLDENRFEIPDVFKLSQKEQRKLDLFL